MWVGTKQISWIGTTHVYTISSSFLVPLQHGNNIKTHTLDSLDRKRVPYYKISYTFKMHFLSLTHTHRLKIPEWSMESLYCIHWERSNLAKYIAPRKLWKVVTECGNQGCNQKQHKWQMISQCGKDNIPSFCSVPIWAKWFPNPLYLPNLKPKCTPWKQYRGGLKVKSLSLAWSCTHTLCAQVLYFLRQESSFCHLTNIHTFYDKEYTKKKMWVERDQDRQEDKNHCQCFYTDYTLKKSSGLIWELKEHDNKHAHVWTAI